MAKYSRRLSIIENRIAFTEDWKNMSVTYKYVFLRALEHELPVDSFYIVMWTFKHTTVMCKKQRNKLRAP
jgi:hypothetical protein